MHEGHHGILEDPKTKKQPKKGDAHHHGHDHDHHHDHDHDHDHPHPHPKPVKQAGGDMWMKLLAGGVVALLVIGFLIWKFI